MSNKQKIGILGGGLTGLTIGAYLHKSKFDVEVLEKNSEFGGLCRSNSCDGFTFDTGGAHIIFSKNKKIVNDMLSLLDKNSHQKRRHNKIFYANTLVKYPFENELSALPKEDTFECLYHCLVNNYPKPKTFKDWMYHTFGKGITEKYLLPYNQKIWNFNPSRMSMHWVEGRVPRPPVEDIIKSAIGISTEGYRHQLYFNYPKKGGIQALIESLKLRNERVTNNFTVKTVRKNPKGWIVSDTKNQMRQYDKIISTIPIMDLASSFGRLNKQTTKAIRSLKYNSLISVVIGINKPDPEKYTAIYFPDKNIKFHRIAFPATFSQYNAPKGCHSIVAEITANKWDGTWEMSDKAIIADVLKDLQNCKFLSKKDVIFSKVCREKYAYVVYDLNYLKHIKIARNYFEKNGIILCGRFSEFEYLNMDACMEHAQKKAKALNMNKI